MLNVDVDINCHNGQYQTLQPDGSFKSQREMSIYFEVDGPYKVITIKLGVITIKLGVITMNPANYELVTTGDDPAGIDRGGSAAQETVIATCPLLLCHVPAVVVPRIR